MQIIVVMFQVTLFLNAIHKSLTKYIFTTFKCKQFTISTKVEMSVLVFFFGSNSMHPSESPLFCKTLVSSVFVHSTTVHNT